MDIKSFESDNGIKLPKTFVEFLLNQNPIDVVESYLRIGTVEYCINGFYPFDTHSSDSLQSAFHNLNEDVFESKYIAFADDGGGWQFVLSLREGDYGKVYFCRMDEALEDALTFLANDFEEFIDKLQPMPEEYLS